MAYNQTHTVQATLADGVLAQATLASGSISITVENQAYGAASYYPNGTVEFPAIDLSKYLNGIPSVTLSATLPSGTSVSISTQTSSDNVTFSSWALLNADNTVASPSARYVKIKLELTSLANDPVVTANSFDASEASQFDVDNQTELNGELKLKTTYTFAMTQDTAWSGAGAVFTYTISRSDYSSIQLITAS